MVGASPNLAGNLRVKADCAGGCSDVIIYAPSSSDPCGGSGNGNDSPGNGVPGSGTPGGNGSGGNGPIIIVDYAPGYGPAIPQPSPTVIGYGPIV